MAATIAKRKGGAYRVKTGTQGNVDFYDEISLWTHASDVTFDDNKTLVEKMSGYASGTLTAGTHQVTIQDNIITTTGMLDIYVPDEYIKILVPDSISRSNNTVTITFDSSVSLQSNVEIRVRCI